MIPDIYLRTDMWEMFEGKFPDIENIEEYSCPHSWWCDCGTVTGTEQRIYFCNWCWKRSEGDEGKQYDDRRV